MKIAHLDDLDWLDATFTALFPFSSHRTALLICLPR
jgi:hypothetical protein